MSLDIEEFTTKLTEWHKHKVTQLQSVVDSRDVDIVLGGDKKVTFDSDSDMANGIRAGVAIALGMLGTLPFTVDHIKCPECLRETDQEELDMFGGFCEECSLECAEECDD